MELELIFLAAITLILGVIITFVLVLITQFFGIDILKNLWLLAIPVVLSIVLNILFLELYRKYKKKK